MEKQQVPSFKQVCRTNMSRSFKKVSICGNSGGSDKYDKRLANRRFRRINKLRVKYDEEPLLTNEVSNVWDMTKDGKNFFDKEKWPKSMRK